MKDLRDPTELGHKLLGAAYVSEHRVPLHKVADRAPLHVRDYSSNLGPIEKYGDPTLLPPTPY